MRRLPRFLAALAIISLPFAAAPVVCGEGEEQPKKPTTDDTSIFKDFNLAKNRGIQHRKDRAAFWEKKGVAGKDLFFLGRLWEIAFEPAKAIPVFEQYLAWNPTDDKDKDLKSKNAERARQSLMEIYIFLKDGAKAVEAAQKYREEYPQGTLVGDSHVNEGKGQRLAGNLDGALAAWTKAMEAGKAGGLVEGCDWLMADGKYDMAKEFAAKWPTEGDAAKNTTAQETIAFVKTVGEPAPALDKAINVGRGEVAFPGKPTLFFYYHMQVQQLERRLNLFEGTMRAVRDKAQVCGAATYRKLNPTTQKTEDDMTPEKEIEWYKKATDEWGIRIPCIVADKEVLDALHLKYLNQMTIIDGEGKLRWMRVGTDQMTPYEVSSADYALKKIAGTTE